MRTIRITRFLAFSTPTKQNTSKIILFMLAPKGSMIKLIRRSQIRINAMNHQRLNKKKIW